MFGNCVRYCINLPKVKKRKDRTDRFTGNLVYNTVEILFSRICKRREILFQICWLLFSTWREYFLVLPQQAKSLLQSAKKSRFKRSFPPFTKPCMYPSCILFLADHKICSKSSTFDVTPRRYPSLNWEQILPQNDFQQIKFVESIRRNRK